MHVTITTTRGQQISTHRTTDRSAALNRAVAKLYGRGWFVALAQPISGPNHLRVQAGHSVRRDTATTLRPAVTVTIEE